MRTAILLGRKHGSKKLELISTETDVIKNKLAFKDHAREGQVHDDYDRVELWISDAGLVKERDFESEATAKAKADAQKRRESEAAKAKADASKKAEPEKVKSDEKPKTK